MPQKRTIPRVCRQCNEDFLAKPDAVKNGGALFCSKACFGASCNKQTTKPCATCGTTFSDKPSARDKFCSRACMYQGRVARPTTYIDRTCEQCGHPYRITQRQASSGIRRYCTPECRFASQQVDPVTMFHRRAIKRGGCWEWDGKTDRRGYPFFELRREGRIVMHRAHRLSYEIHVGGIPHGMSVLHRCDNPPCTNPDHLFVGTARDNSDDKGSKDRQAKGGRLPQTKLTTAQVSDILSRLAIHPRQRGTATKIAHAFNVSRATISDIERGISWKHVPRP